MGFCSPAPCLFSKASLSGCRLGLDSCASGPSFSPDSPRVGGDVSDVHRCRSTLQGTQRPSPGYINISSAIRKDPQTVAKKVLKVCTWLSTPPGVHSPFAQSDRDQGQDKSDDFSEQEDEMCGQTAILSDCSRFCQFINLPH